MIAEEKALADFVAKLATCDRIAIDTEADSLHCYFEKVCLIQISGAVTMSWWIRLLIPTFSPSTILFARGASFFMVRITICAFCVAQVDSNRLTSSIP